MLASIQPVVFDFCTVNILKRMLTLVLVFIPGVVNVEIRLYGENFPFEQDTLRLNCLRIGGRDAQSQSLGASPGNPSQMLPTEIQQAQGAMLLTVRIVRSQYP